MIRRLGMEAACVPLFWSGEIAGDVFADAMRRSRPEGAWAWLRPIRRRIRQVIQQSVDAQNWIMMYEHVAQMQRIQEYCRGEIVEALLMSGEEDGSRLQATGQRGEEGKATDYRLQATGQRGKAVVGMLFLLHSLGSIVGTDMIRDLLDMGVLTAEQVVVITMGSPMGLPFYNILHRERMTSTRRAILGRKIRWIDLYDLDDPVAAVPLASIDRRIAGREVRTGGILSSHVRYWESREVTEIVRGEKARLEATGYRLQGRGERGKRL
jgi:hypothetical protein